MTTKQEKIRGMGYELEESSCHYYLTGAHRRDRFPWVISKKMVAEMDSRDISALKDIVRGVLHAVEPLIKDKK